ncbi:MAG: hydrolase TatD [Firmicutes bacterium HGW-Firmicutes-15]|nr:MAG: hydrolase TatD [Firmicutes bacterium HGW-Firmicutes-15]
MIIDTHAHLQDKKLRENLENVLGRAKEVGVEKIICVGYDLASSQEAVLLARKYKQIYAAVGIHPHDAQTLTSEVLGKIRNLAKDPRVVAIGEIGLDYYRDLSPRDKQKEAFIEQIKLAHEIGKPIIVHDRDANQDVIDIAKKQRAGKNGGIMHCFSGNLPLAMEAIKEGFYISFAGPLTYKNAKKAQEVATKIPQNRLLVETDCPYLTPEPLRGKLNEPAHVRFVVQKMAELRNQHPDEIAYLTGRNAREVYRIKD